MAPARRARAPKRGPNGTVATALAAAEVPFMLTGSVAVAYHGAPRATVDNDLVIAASPTQLRRIVTELLTAGLHVSEAAALETHRTGGMFNVIDASSGWKVDLIHRKEDVIRSKLEWAHLGGSRRQLEDVATLLRVQQGALDGADVARWVAESGVAEEWREVPGDIERDGSSARRWESGRLSVSAGQG